MIYVNFECLETKCSECKLCDVCNGFNKYELARKNFEKNIYSIIKHLTADLSELHKNRCHAIKADMDNIEMTPPLQSRNKFKKDVEQVRSDAKNDISNMQIECLDLAKTVYKDITNAHRCEMVERHNAIKSKSYDLNSIEFQNKQKEIIKSHKTFNENTNPAKKKLSTHDAYIKKHTAFIFKSLNSYTNGMVKSYNYQSCTSFPVCYTCLECTSMNLRCRGYIDNRVSK